MYGTVVVDISRYHLVGRADHFSVSRSCGSNRVACTHFLTLLGEASPDRKDALNQLFVWLNIYFNIYVLDRETYDVINVYHASFIFTVNIGEE